MEPSSSVGHALLALTRALPICPYPLLPRTTGCTFNREHLFPRLFRHAEWAGKALHHGAINLKPTAQLRSSIDHVASKFSRCLALNCVGNKLVSWQKLQTSLALLPLPASFVGLLAHLNMAWLGRSVRSKGAIIFSSVPRLRALICATDTGFYKMLWAFHFIKPESCDGGYIS